MRRRSRCGLAVRVTTGTRRHICSLLHQGKTPIPAQFVCGQPAANCCCVVAWPVNDADKAHGLEPCRRGCAAAARCAAPCTAARRRCDCCCCRRWRTARHAGREVRGLCWVPRCRWQAHVQAGTPRAARATAHAERARAHAPGCHCVLETPRVRSLPAPAWLLNMRHPPPQARAAPGRPSSGAATAAR
jgi:hypothetical protein